MPKLLLAAALLLVAATPFARADQDRVSFGSDITVAEGETAGDIACAFCSVHVHGDVKGDVVVLFGSVTVDPTHTISGDVAILGGDLNLADETEVGGDVAVIGGQRKPRLNRRHPRRPHHPPRTLLAPASPSLRCSFSSESSGSSSI